MRNLTADEKLSLERRKLNFAAFREERLPVLHNFAEILECPEPCEILIFPEEFISYINDFLVSQIVGVDDRAWLLTRIGYFIGELFAKKFDGCWVVDENVESETFCRYVIGQFESGGVGEMFDPFHVAQIYVDTPPPRNLTIQLESLIRDFEQKGA